jgi:hypothetical protein
MMKKMIHQMMIPQERERSGEGSTLFKFIRAGLKLEKASFKNWRLSGGWKKVRSQINKQRNTIQDALK